MATEHSPEQSPYSTLSVLRGSKRYEYVALEAGQIRLLQLCAGSPSDPLRIELHIGPIDKLEDTYAALSYTWGDLEPRQQVICEKIEYHKSFSSDGQVRLLAIVNEDTIDVSPNLYNFLHALRTDSDRMLWADQLCINQNDLEEREHQVALMGRIYAESQFIFVWLSKDLWEELSLVHTIEEFHEFVFKAACKTPRERYNAEQDLNPTIWPTLYRIFSQDYFRRVWIIQELTKAKRAVVMIGGLHVTFDCLAAINTYLQNLLQSESVFPPQFRHFTRPLQKISTIRTRLRSVDKWPVGGKWTLLSLFLKTMSCQCTDQRDRIYAMASLLDNPQHCAPQEVAADYTISYPSLVKSVVSYALTKQHDFTTLYYGYPREIGDLPSWMPKIDSASTYTSEIVIESEHFSAALTREPFVEHCGPGLKFRLTRVGRVSSIWAIHGEARHLYEADGFMSKSSTTLEETMSTYNLLKKFLLANECEALQSPRQAVRAWNFDIWLAGRRFCTASGEDQAKWIDIVDDDELQAKWTRRSLESMSLDTQDPPFVDVLTCGARLRSDCRACILRTDADILDIGQKTLFCWIPEGGRVGDEVALIHGTRMPVLIRHIADGRWAFQGSCYVHGIMDGEVFEHSYKARDLTFD